MVEEAVGVETGMVFKPPMQFPFPTLQQAALYKVCNSIPHLPALEELHNYEYDFNGEIIGRKPLPYGIAEIIVNAYKNTTITTPIWLLSCDKNQHRDVLSSLKYGVPLDLCVLRRMWCGMHNAMLNFLPPPAEVHYRLCHSRGILLNHENLARIYDNQHIATFNAQPMLRPVHVTRCAYRLLNSDKIEYVNICPHCVKYVPNQQKMDVKLVRYQHAVIEKNPEDTYMDFKRAITIELMHEDSWCKKCMSTPLVSIYGEEDCVANMNNQAHGCCPMFRHHIQHEECPACEIHDEGGILVTEWVQGVINKNYTS